MKVHGGLVSCLDDLDELLGNQGSAADQTAVDVGPYPKSRIRSL